MGTSSSRGVESSGEVSRLLDNAEAGLAAVQQLQRIYDDAMWDIEDPLFSKLRHIHLHLSITVGKVAKLVEPLDHEDHRGDSVDLRSVRDDLAPLVADLLIHAAQIANIADGDLRSWIEERFKKNAARFAPESEFAKL